MCLEEITRSLGVFRVLYSLGEGIVLVSLVTTALEWL